MKRRPQSTPCLRTYATRITTWMSRFTRSTAKTKANSVSCLSRESHDWDSQLGCAAGSLTSVRWHTGWRDVVVLKGEDLP